MHAENYKRPAVCIFYPMGSCDVLDPGSSPRSGLAGEVKAPHSPCLFGEYLSPRYSLLQVASLGSSPMAGSWDAAPTVGRSQPAQLQATRVAITSAADTQRWTYKLLNVAAKMRTCTTIDPVDLPPG
jgi:hypothetical protein